MIYNGFYFQQHGCIYVRRNDKGDLERVEKGIRQIQSNGLPVWLVIFPEGTRYNPITNQKAIERSRQFAEQKGVPPFDRVLYPRTGATIAAINALTDNFDAVYDVTVMYDKNRSATPSMTEYLRGQINELHIHITRIPIDSIPTETNEQISNWLYQRFIAQDNQTGIQAQSTLFITIISCLFFLFKTFLFLLTSQGRSLYWQSCLFGTPLTLLWIHFFPPVTVN